MAKRFRRHRLRYFSSETYLEGIKNNRVKSDSGISRYSAWVDSYSRLDIVFGEDDEDWLVYRGVNREVRRRVNSGRRRIDTLRGAVDG